MQAQLFRSPRRYRAPPLAHHELIDRTSRRNSRPLARNSAAAIATARRSRSSHIRNAAEIDRIANADVRTVHLGRSRNAPKSAAAPVNRKRRRAAVDRLHRCSYLGPNGSRLALAIGRPGLGSAGFVRATVRLAGGTRQHALAAASTATTRYERGSQPDDRAVPVRVGSSVALFCLDPSCQAPKLRRQISRTAPSRWFRGDPRSSSPGSGGSEVLAGRIELEQVGVVLFEKLRVCLHKREPLSVKLAGCLG